VNATDEPTNPGITHRRLQLELLTVAPRQV
jgi:hypothetical protein